MTVKSDEEKLQCFAERLDDEGRISIRDLRDTMSDEREPGEDAYLLALSVLVPVYGGDTREVQIEAARADNDVHALAKQIENCPRVPGDGTLAREVERRREAEAHLAEMIETRKAVNPGPSYIQALGWAVSTFGSIAADERERVLRFVEETIESAQAAGVMPGMLNQIIDRTYSRPAGDLHLELAQAGLCLGTLATKIGLDIRAAEAIEFDRIQAIPKEEWERRHAAKVALGIAVDRQGGSPEPPITEDAVREAARQRLIINSTPCPKCGADWGLVARCAADDCPSTEARLAVFRAALDRKTIIAAAKAELEDPDDSPVDRQEPVEAGETP